MASKDYKRHAEIAAFAREYAGTELDWTGISRGSRNRSH